MIKKYRNEFNQQFSVENYQKVQDLILSEIGGKTGFRLSESPIFLPKSFRDKLLNVSESIIKQIKSFSDDELQKAIPKNCYVPNDTQKPHFLAIDFGVCRDEKGEISPKLIELQAFPSLFGFQFIYEDILARVYPFLGHLKTTPSQSNYIEKLKKIIIGNENPENVILLEIFPEKQKTNIDFKVTENFLGIKTVCLTQIAKEGKKLFYTCNGMKTPIHRIYNRVIFDELEKIPNLNLTFDFREELDVEWVTHPNWFFKVSKYILPKLEHEFIPKSYYLHEFPNQENLRDFVLKPLFSFAGSGVNLNPKQGEIDQIKDKENYILQRKVMYEPLFEDANGEFSKAEIRLLYLWHPEQENPDLTVNLVRMTKAAMVNVDFNKKDAIWIGSSVALFG
ncbi:MAG: hypothetical protein ACK5IC_01850 [Moheibacter sp.]